VLVTLPTIMAFGAVALIVSIVPGPDVFFLVTQTLRHGRKAGLASVGAVALGSMGNACATSIGLAAVFAASLTAFMVVKLAGAAYLVILGIKALRTESATTSGRANRASFAKLFRDGFLVALLNPKTALFFAALLPQFIRPNASPLGQSLILDCVFVAISLCTDTVYVLTASALALTMRSRWRPYGRYFSAASFIGLGIYAALASPRSTK
jgi:threonine/homoserine/homoserine lactone efflux protein